MLTEKQIGRLLGKLKRFERTIEPYIFEKVSELDVKMYQTAERLHQIPAESVFTEAQSGTSWGGEGIYCWFTSKFETPAELDGSTLYIRPDAGGYESLLWVDGMPFGTFTARQTANSHGNHYCNMLKTNVKAGEIINIALESYAWHYSIGSQPLIVNPRRDFKYIFKGIDICIKNQLFSDFYFDLKVFNQMTGALDKNSYSRANIVNALIEVHKILYYSPEDISRNEFVKAIEEAAEIMKKLYRYRNTESAPVAAVIGHSHMDTAWQWTIAETVKKCARTYSNQLNLMEQYPEYNFVQSSAYHSKMMMDYYPDLFAAIKNAVKEGRYEPNGAVWVECDCNIVSGEMMLRQFLWGQRFTREHFGYTSNCFWLPDTFGYSAAIPQIMKGCGVDYFLTTKIAWNDTNKFPYDTFYWRGIDGTKVLTHFNKTHLWPDPETCIDFVVNGYKSRDTVCEKTVSNMRLLAYGFGDGGGGPMFEMIEMARRCKNLEGCPKVTPMLVGDFMKRLESSLVNPSSYTGELYLELHRGTLTNQHTIKRNNRLAEIAVRNAEYLTVRSAVSENSICSDKELRPLVEILLVNQFHDILPGTCIPEVHGQSIAETTGVIDNAAGIAVGQLKAEKNDNYVSVINTLPFTRSDVIYIDTGGKSVNGEYAEQFVVDLCGRKLLAVEGMKIGTACLTSLGIDRRETRQSVKIPLYK